MLIDLSKIKELEEEYKRRNGVLKADGIVNINEYTSAETKKKILWVLKEANWDNKSDVNMIDFFQNVTVYPKWKRTYKLIIQVSWSILNGYVPYKDIPKLSIIKNVIDKIAMININKVGGYNKSYWKSISESYLKNKDILLNQVDAINPDLIINCSGVYNFYNDIIIEKYEKENGSFFTCGKTKNGIIINSYHTNQRKIKHKNFYDSIIVYCNKYLKD